MRALICLIILMSLSFGREQEIGLEDAVRIATERHLERIKSDLDLKKIEEQIREVRGSIFPSLGLSAQYIRWDPNYISAFIPENQYLATLTLNQEIFNRSVFMALRVAKRTRALQKKVIEDIKKSLRAEAEKLYWGVLLRREILKTKEESLGYWEEYFKLVEEKFKKGIVPRHEFVRARAMMRSAKAQVIRARSEYRKAVQALKGFLGLEGQIRVRGKLILKNFSAENPVILLEKNNSTLKVLRQKIRAQESAVDLKTADYFPKLRAFANYEVRNIIDFQAGRLVEDTRSGYSFGLRLDFVIFEGLKRRARTQQERIEVQKAVEELRYTRNNLRTKLDSLLEELSSLKEEIGAMEDTLEAERESMRFATERYAEGVGSQIDLLNARTSYENALINYLTLIFSANSVIADIERMIY